MSKERSIKLYIEAIGEGIVWNAIFGERMQDS
jgi:hypothetical protein